MYRSFLQRAGHCISKKPLNKDYLYEGVSQLPEQARQRLSEFISVYFLCMYLGESADM